MTVDLRIGHSGGIVKNRVEMEHSIELGRVQIRLQVTEGETAQGSHKRLENATAFLVQVIGILFSDIRIVFRRILHFV